MSKNRTSLLAAAAVLTAGALTATTLQGSAHAGTAPAAAPAQVLSANLSVRLGDIPDGKDTYAAELKREVDLVLAHQTAEGSLEIQGKTKDLGDNSLGASSLLALYHARTHDPAVVDAFRRSVDWYLANRIYTADNPGNTTVLVKDSGQPWAAYMPYSLAEGGGGDWPTTVWALLHVANVLQYGDGLLRDDQRAALVELGQGYWKWLTKVSQFNPQDADNQAIGAVDAAIQLSQQMTRLGWPKKTAAALKADAMDVFTRQIRPLRQTDRGYTFYPEHSGGLDQNYGGITLGFLWKGWRLTGDKRFYQDGLETAAYLDMRLGARGFDYGGPRHNELRPGYEAVYGLQHYSPLVEDDLGRYLATASIKYTHTGTEPDKTVVPDGHFAFMTIWQFTDPGHWYRKETTVNSPYKLRVGDGSVVLDEQGSAYLVSAGNADVIHAATDGKQRIGLAWTDADGTHFLTPAPGAAPTTRAVPVKGGQAREVTQRMSGPGGAVIPVTTRYEVFDGTVHVTTRVPAGAVPAGVTLSYIAGLPYLTDATGGTAPDTPQQKILGVVGLSGGSLSFAADGADLTDPRGVTAGPMAVTSPTGVTVSNPDAGPDTFSNSANAGLILEKYSTSLNSNPDVGFARTRATNLVQAPARQAGSEVVTDVTYGPAH
ncbi:MAG: hypothetical protein FWE15_10440 [Actinomycetia bacterium]|nr:hypothetical protein [Actinomycetes bacterium]